MTVTPVDNGVRQERVLVTEIPGPRSQGLMARKVGAVSAGVGVVLPAFVERAGGGIMVDVDGNHLIDMGSGIAVTTIGNANPYVADAVAQQAHEFTHTCFMVNPYVGYLEVCEHLNRLTPGDHEKRSALFNSGAEAVENAVKVARSYTKRQAVVVLEHGYHGRTNLTMGLTAKNMPYKHSFGPFAPEIYRVPASYPFRDGPHGGKEVAQWATTRIEKEIGGENVAAIIVEPVQGEGGFIVPAPGYLAGLAEYAKANGIVFVSDEIQSGFCRTGDWFAIELSAVTGRAEMMDAVHPGGLGGTYGGNPVACAAALGSIRWMEENNACGLAREIEEIMVPRLRSMQANFPQIGDVRGRGAMLAIELVEPGTVNPNAGLAADLNKYCHQHGVITLTTGTYGNVFRFLPPLTMPRHLLDEALTILEAGFEASV